MVIGQYIVKFDDYESLESQITTQAYVSRYAESDPSAPCVPKVLYFFKGGRGMGYVVMNYINLTSTPGRKGGRGPKWLRQVPVPRDHVGIGPLGNGLARHKQFKGSTAPLLFLSIEALGLYLNKVRLCLYFLGIHHPLIR
jgi:hypothetical protein